MAKNLIQRMKSGGQIQPSGIPQYQPIQMLEPAGEWQTALDIFNKQFDPELELARDSLDLKRKEVANSNQTAQDTLALRHKELQAKIDSDFRKDSLTSKEQEYDIITTASEGAPIHIRANMARGMGHIELADTFDDVAGSIAEANQAFSEAVSSNDYKQANKVFNENAMLFGMQPNDLKLKEKDLQGMYAKTILPSLLSINGVKDILGDDIYSRWNNPDISNAAAFNAFNSFAPTLSIASDMKKERFEALKEMGTLLTSLAEGAADLGSQKIINNLNEKIPLYTNKLSEFVNLEESTGGGDTGGTGGDTGGTGGTKVAVEPKFRSDVAKVQNSPLWDAKKVTVPGPGDRRIFNVRKAKQTISKILNRNVSEKEARAIYGRLEGKVGRAVGAAQDLAVDIGRGAVAGTRAIAATAKGVPPELAFQGVSAPATNTMMAQPSTDVEEAYNLLENQNIYPD